MKEKQRREDKGEKKRTVQVKGKKRRADNERK